MSGQLYESFEFKYSARKLLKRWFIGLCISILGFSCIMLFSYNVSGSPLRYVSVSIIYDIFALFLTIATVVGLQYSSYPFWRLILNRRVFLMLDTGGLYCTRIAEDARGWAFPWYYRWHIPWADVESVRLEHGVLVKNIIKLTFKNKKGKRDELSIKVICSEYDADYILEAICMNIPSTSKT